MDPLAPPEDHHATDARSRRAHRDDRNKSALGRFLGVLAETADMSGVAYGNSGNTLQRGALQSPVQREHRGVQTEAAVCVDEGCPGGLVKDHRKPGRSKVASGGLRDILRHTDDAM